MSLEKWAAATVLVTGATGFFGGWLVRSLRTRGANVVAVVRANRPESQFFIEGYDRKVAIEWGNVHDGDFLARTIARVRPDFFFHAAYGADVNRVLSEPLECFRSSVESTWVALEAVRQSGRRCVCVISSSDKAYGAQQLPYEETKPLKPVHPYEVAKASLDLAAQSYGKVYGLPVGVTRCGNYFGPYDFNFTRLVPGPSVVWREGRRRSSGQTAASRVIFSTSKTRRKPIYSLPRNWWSSDRFMERHSISPMATSWK